ncbi:hypothetical protein LMG31506_04269 [Cupriavidus yeoncheonensis]|uniref:Uncharacterized protein n=1 Tax=Cupriavidus yeoncheonensis TaxID=1462994 RepID=A0A916IX21_9BURK|nr:hypothetical protein LMG31506_04269 [Cupriavidus yeoncheonensis]
MRHLGLAGTPVIAREPDHTGAAVPADSWLTCDGDDHRDIPIEVGGRRGSGFAGKNLVVAEHPDRKREVSRDSGRRSAKRRPAWTFQCCNTVFDSARVSWPGIVASL